MAICGRCQKLTFVTTGSMFDARMICTTCKAAEECHPDYDQAWKAKADAVKRGEVNFPGIGWPR
jgi:hypothetical protein